MDRSIKSNMKKSIRIKAIKSGQQDVKSIGLLVKIERPAF